MAKLSAYKFINPPGKDSEAPMSQNAGRASLLATNRLGITVTALGATVGDLQAIYSAGLKNDKLQAIAERKRAKREADRKREEEVENQNLFQKGDITNKMAKKGPDSDTKKGIDGLIKSLGLDGPLMAVFGWMVKLGTWMSTLAIMKWVADPSSQPQLELFIYKITVIWKALKKAFGFVIGKGIMDGFAQLSDPNGSFASRITGLGKFVLGIIGLGALLNPFGLMGSILSMLDFVWDKKDPLQRRNDTKANTRKNQKTNLKNKVRSNNNPLLKKYGKNGDRLYRQAIKDGATRAEALAKVRRAANKNPSAFKPPPKTSGLSPRTAPTGSVIGKGVQRSFGRGALKFLGKNNVKLLGKAFQNTFGRIPVFGSILTAIFSLLQGDPWDKVLFKTAGTAVGGALGSFIPLPGLGTLLGMSLGEYFGNLLWIGFKGGGWGEAGQKLLTDLKGVFNQLKNVLVWIRTGWTKFYTGIPKFKIPDFPEKPPGWLAKVWGSGKIWGAMKLMMKGMLGPLALMMGKEIPNVAWMLNLTGNTFPLLHKAFFKDSWQASQPTTQEGNLTGGDALGSQIEGEQKGQKGSSVVGASQGSIELAKIEGRFVVGEMIQGLRSGAEAVIKKLNIDFKETLGKGKSKTTVGKNQFTVGGKTHTKPKRSDFPSTGSGGRAYSKALKKYNDRKQLAIENPGILYGDELIEKYGMSEEAKIDLMDQSSPYNIGYTPSSTADRQKNRHGNVNIREDHASKPEYQNQWWDFLDVFENKKITPKSTSGIGPLAPGYGADTYGKHLDKEANKKKTTWWNPFSWGAKSPIKTNRKKEFGGRIPARLESPDKQFFFGKIFKGISKAVSGVVGGISKAVSGVVNGVSSLVSSVMESPLGSILMTVAPIVFPAAAPFIHAARGIYSLSQGDILGAISSGIGAAHGFSTHFGSGALAASIDKFQATGFGKVAMGFLDGGVSGALSSGLGLLQGKLPSGLTKFLGNIGDVMNKVPGLGNIVSAIPGIGNIPGLSSLFGLGDGGMPGGTFSPMGLFGSIANEMGFGGIFKAITGMVSGGGPMAMMQGLQELAPELGVDPRLLGQFPSQIKSMDSTRTGSQSEMSQQYALQTKMEFIPVPMIANKLVPIAKPVPINNVVRVPVRQPCQRCGK